MPEYQYTAKDKAGEVVSGLISAEHETDLRQLLRGSDLFLVDFERKHDSLSPKQQSIFRPRRVKLDDLVVMSRQLATLVRAGVSIVEALNTVSAQTENYLLSEALDQVRLDVVGGETLGNAMRRHPKIFSELYTSLIDAGEVGGILDQTLDVAATQFDKEAVLRSTVRAALVYPKIVLAFCALVVAFMILWIIPVFKNVYTQFHAKLPAITQFLITVSDVCVHYGWIVILAIIGLFFGFRYYRQTPNGRLAIDRLLLKLPLTGKVARKIAISRFTQTFSSAMSGGIPILKGLAVSAQTAGNYVIRDAVMAAAAQVQEGNALAPPLDASGEFPPLVIRMIAAGEKAGSLSLMLDEVTKFFERDVEYSMQRLMRMMEPLLTVLVGAIVGFVLLGLYMPIFNLANVIKR